MKLMKEYCLSLRELLFFMLNDQERIRSECIQIINNTFSTFQMTLHDSIRAQRASAIKEQ